LSSKVRVRPRVVVMVGKICPFGEVLVRVGAEDETPFRRPGVIQFRLKAVTSKSTQVTLTKRMVPPSQSRNSMRPGRSSHQRTESSGLSERPERRFLRRDRSAIWRA